MTLSGYFMLKSVFGQQGCRALTFALDNLSCTYLLNRVRDQRAIHYTPCHLLYTRLVLCY